MNMHAIDRFRICNAPLVNTVISTVLAAVSDFLPVRPQRLFNAPVCTGLCAPFNLLLFPQRVPCNGDHRD